MRAVYVSYMQTSPPNAPVTSKPSLTESTWEQFAAVGLFWWVNRGLHLFGWALVRVVEADGTIARVYPARCRFRGFDEETEVDGFRRLTSHIRENADDLVEQVTE